MLISDQTPWRNLTEKHVGWDLPLNRPEEFQRALQQVIDMDQVEFNMWSAAARAHGERAAADPAVLEANRKLFSKIAQAPFFTS